MNIEKVDDKPMVIHTKEKTKLHIKTAPETKIKAGNVLTVERTQKFAGAEREAKADNNAIEACETCEDMSADDANAWATTHEADSSGIDKEMDLFNNVALLFLL